MLNRPIHFILAVAFLAAMALAGYTMGAHPLVFANETKPDLASARAFCGFYYNWREKQPNGKGIVWADQHCFEVQEMVP